MIPVVSIPIDVPQHPANDPIVFVHAIRISTQFIIGLSLWPSSVVYSKYFLLRGSLADLRIAVWWFDLGIIA
jgi:hypothetical protein